MNCVLLVPDKQWLKPWSPESPGFQTCLACYPFCCRKLMKVAKEKHDSLVHALELCWLVADPGTFCTAFASVSNPCGCCCWGHILWYESWLCRKFCLFASCFDHMWCVCSNKKQTIQDVMFQCPEKLTGCLLVLKAHLQQHCRR